MSTPDGHLELLLAHAGRGRPVLDEGLPDDAVDEAPNPETSVRGDDAPRRRRSDADPNNLTLQRWGLVAPECDEGDRMLEAISPLIRLRENEQGARACIYRVKPDLDAEASVRWKDEVYWARDVRRAERPLYLCPRQTGRSADIASGGASRVALF